MTTINGTMKSGNHENSGDWRGYVRKIHKHQSRLMLNSSDNKQEGSK